MRLLRTIKAQWWTATSWGRFAALFGATFLGGAGSLYLFVALMDPYGALPLSLPIDRPIISISQRYVYPQIVRSGRFDSLLVGTSTSRLIDPERLNGPFGVRLANLAMDSMTAWEQQAVVTFFARTAGEPKVLIVGLDAVWCDPLADRNRVTFRGFPDWLYDDDPWNAYPYLFNTQALEMAGRQFGNLLGLYPERVRRDGFEVFTPPEDQYDLARAREHLWQGATPAIPAPVPPPPLENASDLSFPALAWLDSMLANMPSTTKILAHMPVHITAQPRPGTRAAAVEAECKSRIAAIARARGAILIDWRFFSPITTVDANYWDPLHYRLPVAQRLADNLAAAALKGLTSADGAYRIVVGQPSAGGL